MAQTLHFRGYAPIPVGHRVELTCFMRSHLLSGSSPAWDSLMVRDIDTGIVYQQPWHTTGSVATSLDRIDYPLEAAPGLAVAGRLEARVLACRVMSYTGGNNERMMLSTTLVIEPAT
jgi:hypothetical protein